MHRALSIVEVVEKIVGYVDSGSLSVLACTATVFERPAYARLYSCVRETCLRSLCQRMMSSSGDEEKDSANQARCLSQASLVREVELHSTKYKLPWNEVQVALTGLRRPLYPFPRLRTLEVSAYVPDVIDVIDVLLCPALETLVLELDIPSSAVLSTWEGRTITLLDSLPERARCLTSVTIGINSRLPNGWQAFKLSLASAIGQLCRRLPVLVNFVADNIYVTANLLRDLASIASLESLGLTMSLQFDIPVILRDILPITCAFRALKHAELRGTTIIGQVVQFLKGAKLRALSVEILVWGPHIADLLDAVCLFAGTLEVLKIWESGNEDIFDNVHADSGYIVPRRTFTLLACCSRMQLFSFTFSGAESPVLEPVRSDLEVFARAWPLLEEFDLIYAASEVTVAVTQLTLDVFVPFSLYCPQLSYINIDPICVTLDVDFPPAIGIPKHPWGQLTIGYPESFQTLDLRHTTVFTHYLDALWDDVFLDLKAPSWSHPCQETCRAMNEILDSLRITRAMRPGSIYRIEFPGEGCQLSDASFASFDEMPLDVCPWEIPE